MSLVLAITLSLTGALIATARPASASKHRKNRKPPAKPARAAAPAGPEAAADDEPAQSPPSGMVDTTLDFPEPPERFPRPSGIPPTREAKESLRERAAALGPCDVEVSPLTGPYGGLSPMTGPDGRPQDTTINVKRVIEGAHRGNPKDQLQVARLYHFGLALPKNDRLAMAWILVACDLGDPAAMVSYGMRLHDGEIVPKDLDKAVEMMMMAGQKGLQEARVNLWGWYIADGRPGFDLVFDQIKLAAEAGQPEAMRLLALCHLNGEGVPQSRELAVRWLKKAERRGWRPAMDELTRLGVNLTPPRAPISGIWRPRPIFK
jgi:hypothetical protein